MKKKIQTEPKTVFNEYRQGNTFKSGIGDKGIFEQTKINERFFVGNQWYGAKCGNNRPLVRHNIIKRIGEYKISTVTAAPIAVNYTADGIPDHKTELQTKQDTINGLADGSLSYGGVVDDIEISFIMSVLSDYFGVTAERVKFDAKKEQIVRNAYISGTGIAYTYWDNDINTGLYVDENKTAPIKGDIGFEVLDVENVVFGDPNNDDIQSQPYIIISQRKNCEDVKREAKRNGASAEEIQNIKPDGAYNYENSGERGEAEPTDSKRTTVLTKFYKEWDENGQDFKVMCVRVTETATVRKPWNIGISLYPLAKFNWERRRSCAYGDSEITYLIPNQIAINRTYSANMWAAMTTGMPMTIINGDIVTSEVTNDPGQIIRVYGTAEEVAGAVRHVQPPSFGTQLQNAISSLASDTLSDSGANDAALGNLRPDNASAIIQMREATLQPMQIYQNRFYDFVEDNARIWAEFWLKLYGNRKLRVENEQGIIYVPFEAERYKDVLISARIDVGASTLWSTAVVVSTLDSLLERKLITFEQYLERLPGGLIPNVTGLKEEIIANKQQQEEQNATSDEAILSQWAKQNPEAYKKYQQLSPEEQQQMLMNARAAMSTETEEAV